jgi:hypothetical protein
MAIRAVETSGGVMMFKVAKLGIAIAAVLALIVPAAYAGIPDQTNSFYVPQFGPTAAGQPYSAGTENALPIGGISPAASKFFKVCPNNEGGTSLPFSVRIKVVVKDATGNPIAGVAAADICMLFNGGTPAQTFSGIGADSVIANSATNPTCPDVRCIQADGPTDTTGTTWISFTGAPAVFGVTPAVRNPLRKWGHFDGKIPVYVLGFEISGRWNTSQANGTYTLRIKNFDWTGGLQLNAPGELVDFNDFAGVAAAANGTPNAFNYWKDFDWSSVVDFNDLASVTAHLNHDCTHTKNP